MYRKKTESTSSHRKNHFKRQMMAIGGGIIVVVLFLAIFGLNSVINFSVWIGSALSGNKNAQIVKNDDFFGALFVDDIAPATNSAELVVSGTSSNFDTLKFQINGKTVKTLQVLNQETFSETIGDLNIGKNEITVVAESKKYKETRESKPVSVTYKNTKPKLSISEPSNDATVNKPEVKFKGETDASVSLEIDGSPVVVTTKGSFETIVRLKEGDNTISVLVIDEAGNEEKLEIKVKYQKED